jgi:hypothetical protein
MGKRIVLLTVLEDGNSKSEVLSGALFPSGTEKGKRGHMKEKALAS